MNLRRTAVVLVACLALLSPPRGRGAAPPASPARTDLYGDPLPPGAIARFGTLRLRQEGLDYATFSPDGKVLAALGYDTVGLWDTSTGKHIRTLEAPDQRFPDLPGQITMTFSPDGKTLASGCRDGTVRIRDLQTGNELRTFGGRGSEAWVVAFGPDGKQLVSLERSGVARLRDVASGKELRQIKLIAQSPTAGTLAFSADGKALAVMASDDVIRLWNLTDGKLVVELKGQTNRVSEMSLSPGGRFLAAGNDTGGLRLWDMRTGKKLHQLLSGDSGWLPSGIWARLKNWALASGGSASLIKRTKAVRVVAFSPDGKLLAAHDGDRHVRFWDVRTGKELCRLETQENRIAYSPDGRTLATVHGSALHLWDVNTGEERLPFNGHEWQVEAVAFSPDGKLVASGGWDNTRLWDVQSGKELRRVCADVDSIRAVAFAPDGKSVLVTGLRGTGLCEVSTGKLLRKYPTLDAQCLAFNSDGKSFATCGPCAGVWVHQVDDQKRPHRLSGGAFNFSSRVYFAASPDGKMLAASWEGISPTLWDAATGEARDCPLPSGTVIYSLAFTPDGKLLASAVRDHTVCFHEVVGGRIVRAFHGEGKITFAPDGRTMALCCWGSPFRIVETFTGEVRCRLGEQGDGIRSASFSPNGELLATALSDTTILVWDVSGRLTGRAPLAAPARGSWETLWADLGADAERGHRAVQALALGGDGVTAFLLERLRQGLRTDAREVERCVARLASKNFAVRERARSELEGLAELAEPALRRALAASPELETWLRIESLLRPLEWPQANAQRTQFWRAVEALEQQGTPAARRALEALAREAPGSWQKVEAQAAAERLGKRLAVRP